MRLISYLAAIVFFVFSFWVSTFGQITDSKQDLIEIPSTFVLVVLADQRSCPLAISTVRVYIDAKTRELNFGIEFKNRSTKRIRSVVLSRWHIGGGGGDLVPIEFESRRLLQPGSASFAGIPRKATVRQLDAKLASDLGFGTDLQAVIVFFVRRVEFVGGTFYDDGATIDRYADFADRIQVEPVQIDVRF